MAVAVSVILFQLRVPPSCEICYYPYLFPVMFKFLIQIIAILLNLICSLIKYNIKDLRYPIKKKKKTHNLFKIGENYNI